MSFYIILRNADGSPHEAWTAEWLSLEHKFTQGFPALTENGAPLPFERVDQSTDNNAFRPLELDKWRAEYTADGRTSADRFTRALDFIEQNPGSYIGF